MNDFYKIGQVIEVRGQKLRIRVLKTKTVIFWYTKDTLLKMCLSVVL